MAIKPNSPSQNVMNTASEGCMMYGHGYVDLCATWRWYTQIRDRNSGLPPLRLMPLILNESSSAEPMKGGKVLFR
jgi:hypothetical protein